MTKAEAPKSFAQILQDANKPMVIPDQLAKYVTELFNGSHEITQVIIRPKREWVGLTDEEYMDLAHRIASKYTHRTDPTFTAYTFLPHTLEQFVRSIEDSLKEKNA